MAELVEIKKFGSKIEADLAAGALESAGIFTHVAADDLGGLRPDFSTGFPVRLLVHDLDMEDAEDILDEYHVALEKSVSGSQENTQTKAKILQKACYAGFLGSLLLPILINLYSIYLLIISLNKAGVFSKGQKALWAGTLTLNILAIILIAENFLRTD